MKLPIISGRELVKFLNKEGFEIIGRKGSHVRMKKKTADKPLITVVPLHSRIDPGTLLAILRQCEISRERLIDNL